MLSYCIIVEMATFQNLVGGFIGTVEKLSNAVEAEKLKVSVNLLICDRAVIFK